MLPKIGLSERDVPAQIIMRVADAALRRDAIIKVTKRWTLPEPADDAHDERARRARVASTDAHRPEDVGR